VNVHAVSVGNGNTESMSCSEVMRTDNIIKVCFLPILFLSVIC